MKIAKDTKFEEGEEYEPDDLPTSDMTKSGNLESLGNGKYVALYDDVYVTFEIGKFRCIEVNETTVDTEQ